MSPGRSFLVTSSARVFCDDTRPKSTITGMSASLPAWTARSTAAKSRPMSWAILMPTITLLCFFAISEVGPGSISASSRSKRSPRIPWPTMLRNAKIRVRERAMMVSRKTGKLRQPDEPASATVVTPAGQRHVVGIRSPLAGVGIAFAGACEDVHMDIDKSGSDVKTFTSTVL